MKPIASRMKPDSSLPLEAQQPQVTLPAPVFPTSNAFSMPDSDDEADDDEPRRYVSRPLPIASTLQSPPLAAPGAIIRKAPLDSTAKLFTADEIAVLPEGLLDRQRQKQLAKKAKKKRLAAGKTEDELMAGFLDMGVEEQEHIPFVEVERPSKKALRKEKKKAQKVVINRPTDAEMDAEARKEADFASFLQTVGEDDMDEDL